MDSALTGCWLSEESPPCVNHACTCSAAATLTPNLPCSTTKTLTSALVSTDFGYSENVLVWKSTIAHVLLNFVHVESDLTLVKPQNRLQRPDDAFELLFHQALLSYSHEGATLQRLLLRARLMHHLNLRRVLPLGCGA